MRAASTGILANLLTTLLLIAMLATLGALVVGLAGFFHGGEFNRKYSNKLMQARGLAGNRRVSAFDVVARRGSELRQPIGHGQADQDLYARRRPRRDFTRRRHAGGQSTTCGLRLSARSTRPMP